MARLLLLSIAALHLVAAAYAYVFMADTGFAAANGFATVVIGAIACFESRI